MRLNRYILVFAAIFVIAVSPFNSCKKFSGSHLPSKTMEQVLFDVSLAESYSSMARDNNHIQGAKNSDSLAGYYKQIFEHYHITQDEFDKSLAWYKNHPDDLDTLYSKVIIRADKMVTSMKAGQK